MADAAKGDEYLFKVLVVGEVGPCSPPPRCSCAARARPPRPCATSLRSQSGSRTAQVAGGKTSLVRRYVYNNFSENYQTTIGALVPPSPRPPRPRLADTGLCGAPQVRTSR